MNQNGVHITQDPFLEAEKPIDLRLILYKYLVRYWYLYALGLVIGLSIAYIQLRYATKQYQVSGKILIKGPDASGTEEVSQEFVLGELGLAPNNKNVLNEIQILKSRTLMMDVVNRLKLFVIYEMEGRIINGEQYRNSPILIDTFKLFSDKKSFNIEAENIDLQYFNLLEGEKKTRFAYGDTLRNENGLFVFRRNTASDWGNNKAIIKFRNPESIAASYAARLNVKTIDDWSSALELSLKDPVSEKAADIINELIEVYNEAAIKDKNKSSENTYAFINERIDLLTQELSDEENNVERFKTNNLIPSDAAANVGIYLNELSANSNELSRLDLQQSILNSLEKYLTADVQSFGLLPVNFSTEYADLTTQVGEYNTLIQERKRRLSTLTENHPTILQMNDKLATSKAVMLSTLQNAQSNLQKGIQQVRQKNRDTQAKLRSIPGVERDLTNILRQKNIKENLYIYLLQKKEEAAISMAVTVSSARVIDPAVAGGRPVEPKPNLYYAVALLLGLGIPFGFIVLKDLLNDTIQTTDDIKDNTKTPLLGTIGFSTADSNVVVGKHSRSAVAEMFRMLRTNLQFINTGQTPQTILVTSSASGEGKTFVTINLGMSIAISGKKTVLVSFDLRKPKLGRYLEQEETLRGMTNYLIGEAQISNIIQASNLHENLYFIPSGPIPPNPAELMMQERTQQLFDYLRQHFDYILIDTPPVGLVSDALLLNEYITGSLFIIRYGITKKGILQFIEDLHREKKLSRLSIVFNGVKARGKYGYGYGYGYGYYEEDNKKGKKKRRAKREEI